MKREAWIERTSAPLPGGPQQLTSDASFVDTLDETGFLSFVPGNRLLMGVGESDAAGIENADLYLAEINPTGGAPIINNLSWTSQAGSQPFPAGSSLSSEDGVLLDRHRERDSGPDE